MKRLTLAEYEMLAQIIRLKHVDTDYRLHQAAYLNFLASGKKKKGKDKMEPVYKKFTDFYDYDKEQKKARPKTSDPLASLKKFLKQKGGNNG